MTFKFSDRGHDDRKIKYLLCYRIKMKAMRMRYRKMMNGSHIHFIMRKYNRQGESDNVCVLG